VFGSQTYNTEGPQAVSFQLQKVTKRKLITAYSVLYYWMALTDLWNHLGRATEGIIYNSMTLQFSEHPVVRLTAER
jgi:hypothetical protein